VSQARPLRVLLVANDGLSAGHVTRMIAIARGLARVATNRGIALGAVLATTSQAHALFASEPLAIATLPAPSAARRAGLSDAERRRLVRAALGGVVDGFGPDLIVVDTFPSGPHGELAGLAPAGRRAKCALVRRSVPEVGDDALIAGLAGYDLAVLAGDPARLAVELPIALLHVPPITLVEAREVLDRADARAALALPGGRVILVAAGGGGDLDAAGRACAIACAIVRVAPEVTPVLALGPLAPDRAMPDARIRVLRLAPIAPMMAAFDGAFVPAGYNTAHELAKARVPAALFAQPRPFDDQAARAARFASAGRACALSSMSDDAIAGALAWMTAARVPEIEAGGADRAAEGLLDLVTGAHR
jgi:UDP-N-acetylglucosamine--N-acetylmuramyl-(pentapeptide) pyrophosphoryl-undecaprenol N-acetylglucosamine transferase